MISRNTILKTCLAVFPDHQISREDWINAVYNYKPHLTPKPKRSSISCVMRELTHAGHSSQHINQFAFCDYDKQMKIYTRRK